MATDPKPKKELNPKYLAFIRTQPDIITGQTPSNAHHTDGKWNDYLAVSIIEPYHTVLGVGVHAIGKKTFQEKHNIDFRDIIIKNLIKYIKKLEGK